MSAAAAARLGFRRPSAVPGFGPAFGIAATGITLLVLVPLAALVLRAAGQSWARVRRRRLLRRAPGGLPAQLRRRRAGGAGERSRSACCSPGCWCATAFPGGAWSDALVDLPFALPTAVAGIALTAIYAPNGWLGRSLAAVRHQGRLHPARRRRGAGSSSACPSWCAPCSRCSHDLEPEVEEAAAAARRLAAGRRVTRVLLPALAPAAAHRLRPRLRPRGRRVRLGHLHRRQHADGERDRAAADRGPAGAVRLRAAPPPSPR